MSVKSSNFVSINKVSLDNSGVCKASSPVRQVKTSKKAHTRCAGTRAIPVREAEESLQGAKMTENEDAGLETIM